MTTNISVVMAFYNEDWKTLERAISSTLEALTVRDEFILICDNPTRKEIVSKVLLISESDPRLILKVNERNVGLVESLNTGLALASGRYIARMDADDVCIRDRFVLQKRFLADNDFDLVGSLAIDYVHGERRKVIQKPNGDFFRHCLSLGFNPMIHPTFFFKSEILSSLDGYRYVDGCEDKDFITRALLLGLKCGNLQKPTILYSRSQEQITSRKYAEVYASGQLLRRAWLGCSGDVTLYNHLSLSPVYTRDCEIGNALKEVRSRNFFKSLRYIRFFFDFLNFMYRKNAYYKLCKKV